MLPLWLLCERKSRITIEAIVSISTVDRFCASQPAGIRNGADFAHAGGTFIDPIRTARAAVAPDLKVKLKFETILGDFFDFIIVSRRTISKTFLHELCGLVHRDGIDKTDLLRSMALSALVSRRDTKAKSEQNEPGLENKHFDPINRD